MAFPYRCIIMLFLVSAGAFPLCARGGAAEGPSAWKSGRQPACVPQEVLVRVKPGVDADEIKALHRRFGGDPVRRRNGFGIHRVRVGKGVDVEKVIAEYRASGLVEAAERHVVRYPMGVSPDDPSYPDQWAVNTDDARNAWSIRRTDRPVVVAVIDTGIDYTHPDLQDSIWTNAAEENGIDGVDDDGNGYVDDVIGWDFAEDDADPMDYAGHGTHVAGVIGAAGNNGIGVAGICWNVRLMPLKVVGDNSSDMNGSDILEALAYAREKGVTVFNCSFGGPSDSPIEYNVFRSLQQNGALVVCAAGNQGVDIDVSGKEVYPASYDLANIIAVAAYGEDGGLGDFSNYGRTSVDLLAPGVNILSTLPVTTAITNAEVKTEADGAVYTAAGMTFAGKTAPEGISGILYDCGYGHPDEIPDAVAGDIALVQRGSADDQAFYFREKVANAQAKGAAGVVIYNNIAGSFSGTLGAPGDWIPAVSISRADGLVLRDAVSARVRLVNHLLDESSLYGQMTGTSMATPYVSGLVALMRARRPDLGFAEVKAAILDQAEPAAAAAGKTVSGGRVSLYDALGEMLTPGDVTGDDRVQLDDLITTLQILSGIPPAAPILLHPRIDVNADGRIGPEEAVYILDRVRR